MGAQQIDTSRYQVSDLDDIEFNWWSRALDMDTVFQPGVDVLFLSSFVKDYEMGWVVEKPILLDEEKDGENLPLWTTVPNKPTNLTHCWALSRGFFGTRFQTIHDYV